MMNQIVPTLLKKNPSTVFEKYANCIAMYVYQINTLYTVNLYSFITYISIKQEKSRISISHSNSHLCHFFLYKRKVKYHFCYPNTVCLTVNLQT